MINDIQFNQAYPYIASFNIDKRSKEYNKELAREDYKKGKPGLLEKTGFIPNRRDSSPTYTRRSPKGKMVVVRKGKRRKFAETINTPVGAGFLAGGVASVPTALIIKSMMKQGLSGKQALLAGGLGVAAPVIAGIGAYKVSKKYGNRND